MTEIGGMTPLRTIGKEACTPGREESSIARCKLLCPATLKRSQCRLCECAACGKCAFFRHRGRHLIERRKPPARRTTSFGSKVLPLQMVALSVVHEVVRGLQQRLAHRDGVAIRIFECSMNCTAKQTERPQMIHGHARMRPECVKVELARRGRPASLLRWDVPAVIFNAGRCTSAANDEMERFPPASVMTNDGYYPHGFVGHNVTGSGVGWIFRPVAKRRRGGAFGHDAWTFNYRLSGTKHNARMAERDSLESCKNNGRVSHSTEAYAEARLASRTKMRGYPPGSAQQIAASFKWGFVNSSFNCWWPSTDWERALADQRAFALLLAKRRETLIEECSIWGSLYNQVHLNWNASDIEAIFYVNDTMTARRGGKPGALHRLAKSASARAYGDALLAQQDLAKASGLVLPIVQYRVSTEECFDGQPLARRMQLATQGKSTLELAPRVFHVPG